MRPRSDSPRRQARTTRQGIDHPDKTRAKSGDHCNPTPFEVHSHRLLDQSGDFTNNAGYQRYQKLAVQRELAQQQVTAAEMNEDAEMNWGMWRWGGRRW